MSEFKTLANGFAFADQFVGTAVDENGDVWFSAKDVCLALEISWCGGSKTLGNMPQTWVMVGYQPTIKGDREAIFINEAGVYKLIFRSNKPKAEAFANWVCEEVLPQLRKNGFFGSIDARERLAYSKQIVDVTTRLTETKDAMLFKLLAAELRDLCNLVGRKMPDLQLLGKDYKQLDLFSNAGQAALTVGAES
ncbi:BRO family protein [Methylomonas sp. EFPC3]|uniref:BRO-N domain-containing protein n=1 Tax=Methylomonas sp. EFPC3 TaxID=3021710 RepID=UPI0024174CE7|nr:BRO family protein [Methylomonas sp. EFPC3]WFP48530.1 BRO family protein [Methylomonas sp. EFPC3]